MTGPLWTAEALLSATAGRMARPFAATGVSIDSRTVQQGDLFIALEADNDGHAHVAAALAAGAAGALVHRMDGIAADAPTLLVPDTLAALHALGQFARARLAGRVVAVTGSVGKTTVKDMLRTALSAFGPTHAAVASYNNQWGLPLTLARCPPEAAFCVAEIGMNNQGEILPLARLAAPHVAVVTTVAAAHIGHLGSLEAIADEKASLLAALQPGGTAVLPADSPLLPRLLRQARGPVLRFGSAADADARLVSLSGPEVTATVAGRPVAFRLAAPGTHMAVNALAALAAVHALGLDVAQAAAALAAFRPGPGRGEQRRIRDDQVLLLDESYNASAVSVRAALDVLHGLPATRRVVVLGDMLELGDHGPAEHDALAPAVAQAADMLYACGPLTRSLFDSVPPHLRGAHTGTAESLAPIVAAAIRPGDAVLVKGSLGTRMRVIVRALEQPEAAGAV